MDEIELKSWLRKNLVIDVVDCDKYGSNLDVYVGLRFIGEKESFSYERINIPQQTDA